MKKFTCLSLLVLCISVAFCKKCFSQNTLPDSTLQTASLSNAIKFYNASIGNQSPLYTGPEYSFYSPLIKGNAYFADINFFTPGSVIYDGVTYKNVPMLYDIYADQLVALLFNNFSKYTLLKDRVQGFDISSHHFIHVVVDTTGPKKAEIKPGFYDEIYNGKIEVLVKNAKNIQSGATTADGVNTYFNSIVDYYLKKDNVYYIISSESVLLNILKDKKKELQQYIKANKIKFRRAPEETMVKIVSYYDQLTN